MSRHLLTITRLTLGLTEGLICAKRSVVPILLVGIICILGNQWLISQEGKKVEVRIEITSVEAKIVGNKDVISLRGKTNLPEGTILDGSLVYSIALLGEPEKEGIIISKRFEVDERRCFSGELSLAGLGKADFIALLPPGIYRVRVGISRRQRKNIREFLTRHLSNGYQNITTQKEVVLGSLLELIEIEKIKRKELDEMLEGFFKPTYNELAHWYKLYNTKRLQGRQRLIELGKWHQTFNRRLGAILVEAGRCLSDEIPSFYKTSYKKVKEIAMRFRDEEGVLFYTIAGEAGPPPSSNDPRPAEGKDFRALTLSEDILAGIKKARQTLQPEAILNLFLMLEYAQESLLITFEKVKAEPRGKELWRKIKPKWSTGLNRFDRHFREIQKELSRDEPVWVEAVQELTQLLAKQRTICTNIIQSGETEELTEQLTNTQERIKTILNDMKQKLSLLYEQQDLTD